ncbi:hypothetical protein FOS14_16300 [Skermania sp. ID1734]|uniref:alpha/beta hydrolase n=1 Tax=Skermania sp. ID1734 TaxID=2597516 RepID=UPI00117F6DB7|nr:alpha/beta-hydrolase family protein [Skermania sp. ID1734]TSD96610.1 hypothetical protein FOS14_16300 [Skermania sp. ID1734]
MEQGQVRLRRGLNFTGALVAVAAVWLSLTPTLLPRSALFQGVVSGGAALIGYAVGVIIGSIVCWMIERTPPARLIRVCWLVLAVVGVLGTVAMLGWLASWQHQLRGLMGVEDLPVSAYPVMVLVGLVVFGLVLFLARAWWALVVWLGRQIARVVPPRVGVVIAAALVVALTIGVLNGVVVRGAMNALNDTFSAVNDEHDADSPAPAIAEQSGGPGSLVSWDSLGRQGRRFVAGGPTTKELSEFNHHPAVQPIRAYVGLDSADTPEAEAAIGVAELDRMGAFKRPVIAVATTTGSGWLNERTASALEYVNNGNTAIVSMQYSYLPSWISFLVDQDRAQHAGRALFDAVWERAQQEPKQQRPKIVVFGESLGSFGGEAAFASLQDMSARADGAVFVGPTSFNVLWNELTDRRESDSPQWLPIYQQGKTARFVAQPANLDRPQQPWTTPKVVYLQYASDPITWWTPDLAFRKPDWLREPRGYDVLGSVQWYPVITFLQVSADMAVSTDVPAGHGHVFGPDLANAWAAVLEPPGWSVADTERLRAVLGEHS